METPFPKLILQNQLEQTGKEVEAVFYVGPWPEMENVNLFSETPFVVVTRPKGPGNCDLRSFPTIAEAKGYKIMVAAERSDAKASIYVFFKGSWCKVDLFADSK
jgi:L-amino acid N-acyltransferase YncA